MADGSTFTRSQPIELLSSSCPHTAMLMGYDGPTADDHARLCVRQRVTGQWFSIFDHDGNVAEVNEATAVMFAEAILRRARKAAA